ncbi:Ubiquitin-like protein 3 [Temnothorax longispinosus]|uniref:Ubiquitin-like protein 3 n=1 Tax=Temnothorax longispinosus TaxID=300112 RepID=A0A4S2JR59_9HYME|nr:Ubiquitin-like protein 3 [Temnothorax longispinosus]
MTMINLRLILVSGKTKEFLFSPSDSAGDIAHHVFENWPEDWAEEAVAKAEILRLIYQGRFLHSNVTLGALGLPFGKTTVMHLVPRENLPEPNSQGEFARCDHVISSSVEIVTKLLVCFPPPRPLRFPDELTTKPDTNFLFFNFS